MKRRDGASFWGPHPGSLSIVFYEVSIESRRKWGSRLKSVAAGGKSLEDDVIMNRALRQSEAE